ncbi:MAG: hypothetical protein R3258_02700 [Acidimicrobiia bacterium]|nr:hypothetical protein [Acidimicrobiia bacterium]
MSAPTLERAGLPRVQPRSLRATWVDFMIDSGVPQNEVRDAAGHDSIEITLDVYKGTTSTAKLADSILAAAARNAASPGQAINAAAGIVVVTGQHSDGRIASVEGLHPDWTPDGAQLDADVIPLT